MLLVQLRKEEGLFIEQLLGRPCCMIDTVLSITKRLFHLRQVLDLVCHVL